MTRNDRLALEAIEQGRLIVKPDMGAIFRPDGTRAEYPEVYRGGAGRVKVSDNPETWSPAHRVIWLAAGRDLPDRWSVRHWDGRRWNNRIENLYATGDRGFVSYPQTVGTGR